MAERGLVDTGENKETSYEHSASQSDVIGVTLEDKASLKVTSDAAIIGLNHNDIEASHIDEIFSAASTGVTVTSRDEYGADFSVTLAATFLDDALLNRHIEFK